MAVQSLKALIFDMDGVITATVELHYLAWRQALAPYGINLTRAENDELRSLTRIQSLKRILKGRPLLEEDQQRILQRKNRFYLESVENLSPADLLPGVSRLIGEARDAGLRCGVASASSNTRLVLDRLDLLQQMDVVVDANDVPVSKPAPDVYLNAARQLNVSPAECLALDDSPAGVQSAARAGMCAVGIGRQSATPEAWAVFENLENVHIGSLLKVFHERVLDLHAMESK